MLSRQRKELDVREAMQRVSCPSCEKRYAAAGGEEASMPLIFTCLCTFCKECALNEEAKAQKYAAGVEKYAAMKADQVSFAKNEVVTVLSDAHQWWIVRNQKGEEGKAPSNWFKSVPGHKPTPCMSCKRLSSTPVQELQVNVGLMRKIAANGRGAGAPSAPSAPPSARPCHVCEDNSATHYCAQCTRTPFLCAGCFASAHKSAKKKGHTSIPVHEHLAPESQRAAAAAAGSDGSVGGGGGDGAATHRVMCRVHKDKHLEFFCDTCNVVVCASCGILEHNGHELTPVPQAVGANRAIIEAMLAEVVVSRDEAIGGASAIKIALGELAANKDAALKVINEGHKHLLRAANKHRDALTKTVLDMHGFKDTVLNDQLTALDDIDVDSTAAMELVQTTLDLATPVEVLERKPLFVLGLAQFTEHTVPVEACCNPSMKFWTSSSFEDLAAGIVAAGKVPVRPHVQKQLCAAVEANNIDKVRMLLVVDNADPSAGGPDDPVRLPMYFAAKGGHIAVAELLLQYKAGVNEARADGGATPVYMAAQEGHAAFVEALLKHSADVNQPTTDEYGGKPPLLAAAENGHTAVAEALLKGNAEVNQASTVDGTTPLHAAAQDGHGAIAEALLRCNADANQATTGEFGTTPLYIAAENGHPAVAEALLKSSANVHQAVTDEYGGTTPLYAAAQEGHAAVVEVLLKGNADVNQATTDDFGTTPLHAAAKNGHNAVAEALLKGNADTNQASIDEYGTTALYLAAANGHAAVAEALLKCKADVNQATTDDGQTPLYTAVENGHAAVAEALLQHNANVNQATTDGWTPLGLIAGDAGHTAVIDLLKQHGAI